MPTGQKTFEMILEEAKEIISKHDLSLEEIEHNTGVELQFVRILFDPSTGTSENISKIFEFLKIRFNSKHLMFKPYILLENKGLFRVRRMIKPYCTMYYVYLLYRRRGGTVTVAFPTDRYWVGVCA